MSVFFTEKDAKGVVDFYRQKLEDFIKEKGKLGVHIVFMDPAATGTGHILYQESIFHNAWKDEKEYDIFARAKAYLSEREKMHNGDVPKGKLITGDVIFRGGAYYKGNSVGISGLVSEDDQSWSLKFAKRGVFVSNRNFKAWKEQNATLAFVP